MIARVLFAVLVGIVAAILVYVLGAGIALVPGIAAIGVFLQNVSWLLGVAAGIYYFVSGRSVL